MASGFFVLRRLDAESGMAHSQPASEHLRSSARFTTRPAELHPQCGIARSRRDHSDWTAASTTCSTGEFGLDQRGVLLRRSALDLDARSFQFGDPRAHAVPALFEPPDVIARFIEKVTKLAGLQPNIDVALRLPRSVAHHRLPADAAFGLFATARSIALVGARPRAIGSGTSLSCPRGRHVGPVPSERSWRPDLS